MADKRDKKIIVEDSDADSEGVQANGFEATEDEALEFAEAAKSSGESSAAEELAASRAEAKDNYDRYLRAVADLDNFKKRAIKERSDMLRYAGEGLARDVVEVVDNLELAVKQTLPGANDELVKGVKMVLDQMVSALGRHGINAETSLGEIFDPEKQEALASMPAPNTEPGTILEEFKKAYFIKDKLLRPGKVVVAAAVETGESDGAAAPEQEN